MVETVLDNGEVLLWVPNKITTKEQRAEFFARYPKRCAWCRKKLIPSELERPNGWLNRKTCPDRHCSWALGRSKRKKHKLRKILPPKLCDTCGRKMAQGHRKPSAFKRLLYCCHLCACRGIADRKRQIYA